MLGKLLKYEMRASSRTLLPLYLGTLLTAIVVGVQLWGLNREASSTHITLVDGLFQTDASGMVLFFSSGLLFALCMVIMVLTAVIIVQRFNKSLLGDEGYLMFTLPVTHPQLLWSKLIAALLWIAVGTVVMGLAAVLTMAPMCLSMPWLSLSSLLDELRYLFQNWNPIPYLSWLSLDMLVSAVATILTVYLSLMIGQLEQCSKYRVIVAVLMFFLINWAFDFLISSMMMLFGVSILDVLDPMGAGSGAMQYLALWGDIGVTLLQCVLMFMATVWLMRHKLNL